MDVNLNVGARNIQEYVINYIIRYIEEKDLIIEELKKKLDEKDRQIYYFKQKYNLEKCHHCGSEIFIDQCEESRFLHIFQKFRKCANVENGCKFIICGVCAGDFVDPTTFDYTGVYRWTGNPWLGVPPRPVEDYDYICGEEYCPK